MATTTPEFATEGVLDPRYPGQTFGIEIEFEGGNPNAMARELWEAGLCASPRQEASTAPRAPGKWTVEFDTSVTGGELVSPILRDTKQDWDGLKRVLAVIVKHGGQISQRTGCHVHVGVPWRTGQMSVTPEEARMRDERVAKTYARAEEWLFRSGSVGGTHRGVTDAYNYCAPAASTDFDGLSLPDMQAAIAGDHNPHWAAINLATKADTVELRHFGSNFQPWIVQAYVKLACAVVHRGADPSLPQAMEPTRLGHHVREGSSGLTYFRDVIHLLFGRASDRAVMKHLFAVTDWQIGPEQMGEMARTHQPRLRERLDQYLAEQSRVITADAEAMLGRPCQPTEAAWIMDRVECLFRQPVYPPPSPEVGAAFENWGTRPVGGPSREHLLPGQLARTHAQRAFQFRVYSSAQAEYWEAVRVGFAARAEGRPLGREEVEWLHRNVSLSHAKPWPAPSARVERAFRDWVSGPIAQSEHPDAHMWDKVRQQRLREHTVTVGRTLSAHRQSRTVALSVRDVS